MSQVINELTKDVRFREGMNACINCGTCTAICAAAEFYNYDPRQVMVDVQSNNEDKIIDLLKSETIWYCGECMSCKTRCPRNNTPGLVIMALRALSQKLGYFTESEKGRQQLFIKRVIGGWILKYGYCLYLEGIGTDMYAEQGTIWDWRQKSWPDIMARLGANYKGDGPGILRKIPEEALEEVRKIFEVTGGMHRFNQIEDYSKKKANEMNLEFGDGIDNEYLKYIFSNNNKKHNKE